MQNFKRQTIWTIALSFFIIIGAGHGIACLGLVEIIGIMYKFNIGTGNFSLLLTASYEKSIFASALFAFIGNVSLIVSIANKSYRIIFWTRIAGLIFLWISLYYLTHHVFNDGLSQISFITGLPCLTVSILLAYETFKQELKLVTG